MSWIWTLDWHKKDRKNNSKKKYIKEKESTEVHIRPSQMYTPELPQGEVSSQTVKSSLGPSYHTVQRDGAEVWQKEMGKLQISIEWVAQCFPFTGTGLYFQQRTKGRRNLTFSLENKSSLLLFLIFNPLDLKVKLCSIRNTGLSVKEGAHLSQLSEGSYPKLPELFFLCFHWPKTHPHPEQWHMHFSHRDLWNGTWEETIIEFTSVTHKLKNEFLIFYLPSWFMPMYVSIPSPFVRVTHIHVYRGNICHTAEGCASDLSLPHKIWHWEPLTFSSECIDSTAKSEHSPFPSPTTELPQLQFSHVILLEARRDLRI